MPLEQFIDKEIRGRKFRIFAIPANKGTWMTTVMLNGKSSDEEVFRKIQSYTLDHCSLLVDNGDTLMPMKVWDSGTFLIPDLNLERDIRLLNAIIVAVTEFNFRDFFEELAAEAKTEQEETKKKKSALAMQGMSQ
jgi:hypothetical protein